MPEVDVKQEVLAASRAPAAPCASFRDPRTLDVDPAGSPGPGNRTRLEGELAGNRAS